MKRNLTKITGSCLIPLISLAAVLCCNFMGVDSAEAGKVSAALAKAEKLPPCHKQKEKTPVPDERDCSCCQEKKLQADLRTQISVPNVQEVIGYLSFYVLPQDAIPFKNKITIACLDGPPGPVYDTPLYLAHHNFRI